MRDALQALREVREARYSMGTLIEIAAFDNRDGDELLLAVRSALAEFERLEKIFSYFDTESELSQVNRDASKRAVKVSREFFQVVSQAVYYARCCQNIFSISLAPLFQCWHRSAEQDRLPAPTELADYLMLSDYRLIELDDFASTIFFARAGVSLDLSGFVKGYAVDRAQALLVAAGIERAIINAGTSSIAVIGPAWQIGLRQINEDEMVIGSLSLSDCALSTSGTNQRGFFIEGRYYSQLLDGRTGFPLTDLLSSTVLCQSAMQAEVISKLVLLLGAEQALQICDANQWPAAGALIQRIDRDGTLSLEYSDDCPIDIWQS